MFRLPSFGGARYFSSSVARFSFIGRTPVRLLENVECSEEIIPPEFCRSFTKGKQTFSLNKQITVKGPKGVIRSRVPEFVRVRTENNTVSVSVSRPKNRIQRSMWGTTRAMIENNVIGTTEGHLATVKFVGTGFRASLEDVNGEKFVALKIGLPYSPKLKIPAELTVTSPNPTTLLVEGIDKQKVKLFAALVREQKKPEPYKGKGIFVDGETIKLKQKKIK